jgi:NDP-sugar pyrophosphorylase family protein/aminoglycoside/choline kinase family phosphotransferase
VTVFILAAGLGERLRPITRSLPKPLLPIAGRPVIEMVLQRVSPLRPRAIGMNIHYLADTIAEWLAGSACAQDVTLFREEPILGTGGALANAGNLLSHGTFLTHNADIISSVDLEGLVARHRSEGNLATLAVHDLPRFNNVLVDDSGQFAGIGTLSRRREGLHLTAFMGIAVYEPAFLNFLPAGASSVVDAWLRASHAGRGIGTADLTGAYWTDIGTPSDYAAAVISDLRSRGETIFIHPSSQGCRDAGIDGYVVVEANCTLGKASSLRNCIVLPGSSTPPGSSHENSVLGPDFALGLAEADMLGFSPQADAIPVGTGGSDRQFSRVRRGGTTSVLMRCRPGDPDLLRQIEYARFFGSLGLPAARVTQADGATGEVLFEDLGDLSLYSWLRCRRSEDEIEGIYRQAVEMAGELHTRATSNVADCTALRERVFDYDHFRWETSYFMERFVGALCNMGAKDPSALEEEFHRLASAADGLPKTVIHRDLQCQNIMVTAEGSLRFIDYQGARLGPPAYDLASLLWDPYHRLPDHLREDLVAHYLGRMRASGLAGFGEKEFLQGLRLCRLQRHMQALGAYGFLSLVKGKRHFLRHVPEGLRLLGEDLQGCEETYPALSELVRSIGESFSCV